MVQSRPVQACASDAADGYGPCRLPGSSETLLNDVYHVAPTSAVVGTGRAPSLENWSLVVPLTILAELSEAYGPEMIALETPA